MTLYMDDNWRLERWGNNEVQNTALLVSAVSTIC